MDKDDGIRPDISVATLAALKPVFKKGGTTTAGNSSQVGPQTLRCPQSGALAYHPHLCQTWWHDGAPRYKQ